MVSSQLVLAAASTSDTATGVGIPLAIAADCPDGAADTGDNLGQVA